MHQEYTRLPLNGPPPEVGATHGHRGERRRHRDVLFGHLVQPSRRQSEGALRGVQRGFADACVWIEHIAATLAFSPSVRLVWSRKVTCTRPLAPVLTVSFVCTGDPTAAGWPSICAWFSTLVTMPTVGPPAARTSKASGPLKADPATTATAIAMLYAQPTKLPPGSAAKGGFADRSKAVFTLTTCARTNKQPADFYL